MVYSQEHRGQLPRALLFSASSSVMARLAGEEPL